jgi:hypothetical protein
MTDGGQRLAPLFFQGLNGIILAFQALFDFLDRHADKARAVMTMAIPASAI